MLSRRVRGGRSIPGWAWALVIYAVAAATLVGRQAIADPAHECLCLGPNGDPPFFMWALKWWPYAVSHHLNPFYTDLVWYPGGANIATTTGIPGVAIVLWPVTSLFGPLVSYNLAAFLSPVLASLAAYALCGHVTSRRWPSVVGGFLFGFSSYELAQLTSHLQVALVFLVPVIVLVILRRHERVSSRGRFVLTLATVLAGQVLISTEVTFDIVLLGGIGLLVWWCVAGRADRRGVVALTGEIAAAGLLAVAVVSPYLYWAVIEGNIANYGQVVGTIFAERYRLDLLNLFVPTHLTWLGGQAFFGISSRYDGGNPVEAGGYLGIPVLLLLVGFARATWRARSTRFLLVMSAVTVILAFGPRLSHGSQTFVRLPWILVENAPAFRAILPTRLVLFLGLIAAVAVALELSRTRRRPWLAWVLVLAGVVALVPSQSGPLWHSRPPGIPLVLAKATTYLPALGSVLMVPVGQFGSSMYWQAEAGFDFRLANGRVALVLPPEYGTEKASLFMANDVGPPPHAWLRDFLTAHQVTAVVVGPDPLLRRRWDTALRLFGLQPAQIGEEAVYYVCGIPTAAGSCEHLTVPALPPVNALLLSTPVAGP
ncbi:MAG: hypothetical protein QOH12_1580 [Solirubrobacteraceae bacterium]|nr:hypothetical protein [Solirubrobacteraceae bacterium]